MRCRHPWAGVGAGPIVLAGSVWLPSRNRPGVFLSQALAPLGRTRTGAHVLLLLKVSKFPLVGFGLPSSRPPGEPLDCRGRSVGLPPGGRPRPPRYLGEDERPRGALRPRLLKCRSPPSRG
ncbi:Tectonic-1 [Manis pentadactyla]|nr:Tectonic-1 [Manis pentadactyla]